MTTTAFYNEPFPLLLINKKDELGEPLGGACFTAYTDLGGGVKGAEVVWMEGNDLAILTETAGLARSLIQEITSWWKLSALGL